MNCYLINKKTESDLMWKFKIDDARNLSRFCKVEKFMINNVDDL